MPDPSRYLWRSGALALNLDVDLWPACLIGMANLAALLLFGQPAPRVEQGLPAGKAALAREEPSLHLAAQRQRVPEAVS